MKVLSGRFACCSHIAKDIALFNFYTDNFYFRSFKMCINGVDALFVADYVISAVDGMAAVFFAVGCNITFDDFAVCDGFYRDVTRFAYVECLMITSRDDKVAVFIFYVGTCRAVRGYFVGFINGTNKQSLQAGSNRTVKYYVIVIRIVINTSHGGLLYIVFYASSTSCFCKKSSMP